jgi:hypothetical protein
MNLKRGQDPTMGNRTTNNDDDNNNNNNNNNNCTILPSHADICGTQDQAAHYLSLSLEDGDIIFDTG